MAASSGTQQEVDEKTPRRLLARINRHMNIETSSANAQGVAEQRHGTGICLEDVTGK